jgi:hypothetical protein
LADEEFVPGRYVGNGLEVRQSDGKLFPRS